jgi:hypothetical protein
VKQGIAKKLKGYFLIANRLHSPINGFFFGLMKKKYMKNIPGGITDDPDKSYREGKSTISDAD